MAWTELTFPSGSKLTSTKMSQVQSNFAALAAGEAGAPPLAVNSFMASGVSSLGLVNADSGYMTSGVSSLGLVNANGGYLTTQVGSFGSMDVSSAITIRGAAASPPAVNTLYKENVPKGWINFNGTGTIAISNSFNVASITDNGAGDYTVTWDTDFASAGYCATTGFSMTGGGNAEWAELGTFAAGSLQITTKTTVANADAGVICVTAHGDQ